MTRKPRRRAIRFQSAWPFYTPDDAREYAKNLLAEGNAMVANGALFLALSATCPQGGGIDLDKLRLVPPDEFGPKLEQAKAKRAERRASKWWHSSKHIEKHIARLQERLKKAKAREDKEAARAKASRAPLGKTQAGAKPKAASKPKPKAKK